MDIAELDIPVEPWNQVLYSHFVAIEVEVDLDRDFAVVVPQAQTQAAAEALGVAVSIVELAVGTATASDSSTFVVQVALEGLHIPIGLGIHSVSDTGSYPSFGIAAAS